MGISGVVWLKMNNINFDIFEAISEHLLLEDVVNIGKTCYHLIKVAGEYFNYKYTQEEVQCRSDGIFIGQVNLTHFLAYIKQMDIWCGDLKVFKSIESQEFECLDQINLHYVSLTDEAITSMKDILNKVEVIKLYDCSVKNDFFDAFLERCVNMKGLWIEKHKVDASTVIGRNNNWMLKTYPQLEHFGLVILSQPPQINHLDEFFEKNPNIRSCFVNSKLFYENRNIFLRENRKFDMLIIQMQSCKRKIRSAF